MVDVHIHTRFSPDSQEPPESYVKLALARGDRAIGFADHCEYNMREYDPDFYVFDTREYLSELDRLRKKYGQIKILTGVELGYSQFALPYYEKMLANNKFDYAIMSVHTISGVGDCYDLQYKNEFTKREIFDLYLHEVYKSVSCDIPFNIMGHIGYVARYTRYADNVLCYSEFSHIIDKILNTLIDRDAAFELNTSVGSIKGEFVTDTSIAARYVELGGQNFSFASDAHSAGRYFDNSAAVKRFLHSLGIDHTVIYESGKKQTVPFAE